MIQETEVYKIGQLGKPHGVKGEISFSFTDDVWDRAEADYLVCRVEGILVPFFLEEYRFRSDSVALLKFAGMDSLSEVEEMRGCEVYFPYALRPKEEADEYTWKYFTGFRLVDAEKGEIGCIDEVDDTTQNVLFRVGQTLIPAAEEFIEGIDHGKRIVEMRLPEGLLEI